MTLNRLCVFCGSSPGASPRFAATARHVGRRLAERGIGLVYGGGNVGLMGELADGCLTSGGHVTGIIPSALVAREVAHRGLPDLRVVATMHERKALMADLSDGFLALPGGLGTLDELFEAMTWTQLGVHRKPCALLDVDGFYASLVAFLDHAVTARFLPREHGSLLLVGDGPDDILDRMAAWTPPTREKWLDRSVR
jgi:uncharacterized protein (TIGR00730 family)